MRTVRRDGGRLAIACATVVAVLGAAAGPAAAAAENPARIVSEERIAPRVVELTITTPAFTTPTKVHVDLPTGYDDQPDRRWPVSYFLAGTQNTYKSFNNVVGGVELTKDYPSIVVSPNGDSGYWSDWYNDGKGGPPMYESYVIDQLLPLIDQHFRTIPDRAHRVIAGVSMGGYGATMFAARHPDLFSAVATISGAVDSNLTVNGAVLAISPVLQGGQRDAIYGPRLTQEVRWRGHNPADLAGNLRTLDVQVRSANGTLDTGIGENPLSADAASCVVEAGVYAASTSLHDILSRQRIPHLWKDYGDGCHTVPNFKREIADTLTMFTQQLAEPSPTPKAFDYATIEPDVDVWGWHVVADPKRPLEFLRLSNVRAAGLALTGSGTTRVTTPALFRGVRTVEVAGTGATTTATPDAQGRLTFRVDLGAPNATQQYVAGAKTAQRTRTVTFRPYAHVGPPQVRATKRSVRVCATATGGTVTGRVRVSAGGRALARDARIALSGTRACRTLTRTSAGRTRATVVVDGRDRYGHAVTARRAVRLP
jgi:S-formylglutathione hydrolase FrmB